MSEWRKTTLGEVALVNPEKTPSWGADHKIRYINIASVDWDKGIDETTLVPILFSEAPGRARRRVREGDVLVSTVRPNLRAFARIPGSLDAEVASTGFAVLRATKLVIPGFIWCPVSSDFFRDDMTSRCTGSNYPAIRSSDVGEFRVTLPSLDEQRHIIDVVSAVDIQIDALRAERKTLDRLLVATLKSQFSVLTGPARAVDSLCSLVIGGIWGEPPGGSETELLALGPRIYTPGTSSFVANDSPYRSYPKSRAQERIVQTGDIILERSGGSPGQPVGRVVIAGDDLPECIPTDFQRLLRPDPDQVEPQFLFWKLKHDWANGVTKSYSRRTTGITNLSVKDYLARQVTVPERSEQRRIAAIADALEDMRTATSAEAERLRVFRSNLLTALLSQSITIPEAYDALLDVVPAGAAPEGMTA